MLKHAATLLGGFLTGIFLFVVALYANPFAANVELSPIAVTDQSLLDLSFSAVPTEALLFTNDGESTVAPNPAKVLELWEPTIQNTWVMVSVLSGSRGEPVGLGIKFSSESDKTRLLSSEVLVDSVWQVYLPGQGTFFMDQTENYWSYLTDIVVPAKKSSADNWKGTWHRQMTIGPGALGTARVVGTTGRFAGIRTEAIESLSARAYSANSGPVAMAGSLTVALPGNQQASESDDF